MSEMSEMVKDNFEFLEQLAAIYQAKGYKVSASLYPEVGGYCSGNVYVMDPENREETGRTELKVYRALNRPGDYLEDVPEVRQKLLQEAHGHPSLIEFRRGNVLRHIEKLREMSAAADLPDDFLNPVMEWVERLKTTMLPPPSTQHPAPSTSSPEDGDDIPFQ